MRRISSFMALLAGVAICVSPVTGLAQTIKKVKPGVEVKPVAEAKAGAEAKAVNPAAEADAPAKARPVAEIDSLRHDFGDVWVNTDLRHSYTITNTGDAPLKIVKVKPACGCTKAGPHPKEIKPGEKGEFSFKLNTKRIKGRFTKAINITTDDPANKSLRLSLAGNVRHYVSVAPSTLQFGRVRADTVDTKTLTVTNNTEDALELNLDTKRMPKWLKPEISELVPGKKFEVKVTAQPPFNEGINRYQLKVGTNNPKQSSLQITCMATLPKRLELRPDRIMISPAAKTETVRQIQFANNGETPVKIVSAKGTDDKITAEVSEIAEGRTYRITARVAADYKAGASDAAIVLTTDDKDSPELRVPIQSNKRKPKPERPAMKMLGKEAPTFTVKDTAEKGFSIGGKQEEVQVLCFYASWCGFCKKALPKLQDLHKKFESENIKAEVITVNLDARKGRRAKTVEQTMKTYNDLSLSMPLVLNSANGEKLGSSFKVTSFPTMFVVSKTGVIEAVHVGAKKQFEKTIEQQVATLLEGKTRADFPNASASGRTVNSIPERLKLAAQRDEAKTKLVKTGEQED